MAICAGRNNKADVEVGSQWNLKAVGQPNGGSEEGCGDPCHGHASQQWMEGQNGRCAILPPSAPLVIKIQITCLRWVRGQLELQVDSRRGGPFSSHN